MRGDMWSRETTCCNDTLRPGGSGLTTGGSVQEVRRSGVGNCVGTAKRFRGRLRWGVTLQTTSECQKKWNCPSSEMGKMMEEAVLALVRQESDEY